jgi:hypothetical protein
LRLRRFLKNCAVSFDSERCTYAKTMPDWPHEHLVRDRVDQQIFERLVLHIRSNGYVGCFYRKEITYEEADGRKRRFETEFPMFFW